MIKKIIIFLAVLWVFICAGLLVSAESSTVQVDLALKGNTLTISGVATSTGNWVTIYLEDPNNALFYTGSSTITNDKFSISFSMLEQLSGLYTLSVNVKGMNTPYKTIFEYVKTPSLSLGDEKIYMINGKNLNASHGHEISMVYDPDVLEVSDLCSMTQNKELSTGTVQGTDITITSKSNGLIKFKKNIDVSENKVWSGTLNAVTFKVIKTGNAVIAAK